MIPLFIQWTDVHVYAVQENATQANITLEQDLYHKRLYESMIKDFEGYIRDDVLYVTLCQDDQGASPCVC